MFVVTKQRRRLGQLVFPDVLMPSAVLAPAGPPSAGNTDASWCWLNYLFGKSSYDACVTAANQAQIQQVANNAAFYYPNSPAAQVAQTVATQQEAQVPGDVQTIDASYNLPSSPFLPSFPPGSTPGSPSTWPIWVWVALGFGGLVLVKALK